MSEKNIIQFSNAVPESEIMLLRKWNCRLIPKELSKKFTELILGEDPQIDLKKIKRKWFDKIVLSKDGLYYETAPRSTYSVETSTGRELLLYFIKDSDIAEFEGDMWTVWKSMQNCFDKEWWQKEYGEDSGNESYNDLFLVKRNTIIRGEVKGLFKPVFKPT